MLTAQKISQTNGGLLLEGVAHAGRARRAQIDISKNRSQDFSLIKTLLSSSQPTITAAATAKRQKSIVMLLER